MISSEARNTSIIQLQSTVNTPGVTKFYRDKQIKAHAEKLRICQEKESRQSIQCGCPDAPLAPENTKKLFEKIPQDYNGFKV